MSSKVLSPWGHSSWANWIPCSNSCLLLSIDSSAHSIVGFGLFSFLCSPLLWLLRNVLLCTSLGNYFPTLMISFGWAMPRQMVKHYFWVCLWGVSGKTRLSVSRLREDHPHKAGVGIIQPVEGRRRCVSQLREWGDLPFPY